MEIFVNIKTTPAAKQLTLTPQDFEMGDETWNKLTADEKRNILIDFIDRYIEKPDWYIQSISA